MVLARPATYYGPEWDNDELAEITTDQKASGVNDSNEFEMVGGNPVRYLFGGVLVEWFPL